MGLPRALPIVAGALALIATITIIVIHVVLAAHIPQVTPVRTSSVLSSVLESILLAVLGWMSSANLIPKFRNSSKRLISAMFGVSVLTCTLATAASVATMICLGNATRGLSDSILGAKQTSFLIASSVALGLCFACQLIFIVIHFVLARLSAREEADSYNTDEESTRRSPHFHTKSVKSIPYTRTSPTYESRSRSTSMGSQTPPQSSSGRSATETLSSIRSSLSNVVRPISSRTRLLPLREKRRAESIDSNHYRSRSSSVNEDSSFDSWDTSSVDMQSRMTVLGTSSPPGRFLETIPASPTTSRSPSPGTPLDLEPPRARRRSRSYSPVADLRRPNTTFTMQNCASDGELQRPEPAFTMQGSASESHIHPLFRSDSPDPPPMVTPGTMVVAAPDAGRVISDRHSVRRMRSGSLPSGPSPLSRTSSIDNFFPNGPPVKEEKEELESPQEKEELDDPNERQMTPPIPEWILTAGARTSLNGYHSRKLRIEDGDVKEEQS
ncbi:hypothetical protein COL154_010588 [Colletotrichum chrysophilum]|uniref:uncharacterized protein n=1 Tax=Colletotrichum chrysophilum TaxID=1836956 RepID=UPI002300D197|nr:uncharacterized protein COL26b_010521 [Colletotrichum chrysophilum]KAJ0344217.1 hypothetical protein KNSL1_009547 [Colletotrichum chrysophilum]KAJ0356941.1 hypothetical protein COL154_010588 [Colletotrichum chrysophilum]KAJ0369365.1 hypothetical protein COL26b_010521 [Colletotrichum chrysophilum]